MDAIPSGDMEKAHVVMKADHEHYDTKQDLATTLPEKEQKRIMYALMSQGDDQ